MTEIFLKIVNMSISATYLVLAVILLRLVLKKAPKWVRVLLWGLVALRLVCPFTLESALSLIPSAETVSPEIMLSPSPTIHTGIEAVNSVVNPVFSEVFAPEPAASANPLQIWIPVLSVVWLAGMALMTAYTLISYCHLRRQVKLSIRVRGNVYLSEFVSSPFVLGVFRPKIYLPYHMSEQDQRHVLAHERAHIRRRDHWWKPLGFLLLTLHWFNPLMWIAYILLCRDIELACDEKVIQELGIEQRADYSQALLNCSINRKTIAACPVAFGEVGVKQRVKNVLHYKKPAFWVVVIAVLLCAVVAVCFLTNPADESHDLTVSFEDLDETQITKIKLTNMHNGTISWHDGTDEIRTICGFLKTVSGSSGVSSKGIYEGTYSLTLYTDSEEISIGFGDTAHIFYGDYGDGYPVMYDLDSMEISDVTAFFRQYDISTQSKELWGIHLSIQDITSLGATIVFNYGEETVPVNTYYCATDYMLKVLQDGNWVEPERLAQEDKYTSAGSMDISTLLSQYINWESRYGVLPAGTYRIEKTIYEANSHDGESQTLYVDFTIEDFPAQSIFITAENVTPTGLTVVWHHEEGITWITQNNYRLQQYLDGEWTDLKPSEDAVPSIHVVNDPDLPDRQDLNWSTLYGVLPSGTYRVGKEICPIGYSSFEVPVVYAEFTITDDP